MTLDLSPFANALAQLERSLVYCASELARQDLEIGRLFRAAAEMSFPMVQLQERSGAP